MQLILIDYEDSIGAGSKAAGSVTNGNMANKEKDHIEITRAVHDTFLLKHFMERLLNNVSNGGHCAMNSMRIL